MNILQLNTSLHGNDGTSSQLAGAITQRLLGDGKLTLRDLNAEPIPHLDAQTFSGFQLPAEQRTGQQAEAAALSDCLIEEIRSADTVVLGLPMYNFGVPSVLKAWIDNVLRVGVTFGYTSNGPEGYMTGKKLVVAAARGGHYAGTEADLQSPYLRQVFAFIGISDVEFVYAEGLASEGRDAAIDQAYQQIAQLAV